MVRIAFESDGGAAPLIESNELTGGPYTPLFDVGEGVIVRGTTIGGTVIRVIGLSVA